MPLEAYLKRIDYRAPNLRPDLATLRAVHRAHALAIPYENLDIQLGRGAPLSEKVFFDKIVRGRRGGWCYENNGLLTWALREIGFDVQRVAGAVSRDVRGDAADGNHLVGLVDLERRWVVDVGLGDGPLEPFPLCEGRFRSGSAEYRLERVDGRWWRYHNRELGMARSYDFDETPRELDGYQPRCTELQTSQKSSFVRSAITSRIHARGYSALIEVTRIEVADGERVERPIEHREDYRAALTRLLGRDLGPDGDRLWEKVSERVRRRAIAEEAGRAAG